MATPRTSLRPRLPLTRLLRALLGALAWAGLVAWGISWSSGRPGEPSSAKRVGGELFTYAAGNWRTAQLHLTEGVSVAPGDPIFLYEATTPVRQIGRIESVAASSDRETPRVATAVFYPITPPNVDGAEVTSHATPHSMEWVVETMLPPEKRALIAEELRRAMQPQQDEFVAGVRPIVQGALRDAFDVVQADLPKVLAAHREELNALGARYQKDLVEKEVVPLVRDEIMPLVRRHAEPVATEVGRDLWAKVSLWRFGWRYVYDRTPLLPDDQLVKREWARYVDEDAMPILEAHTDDFVRVVRAVLAESAKEREVQKVLKAGFSRIIEDEELQRLVWRIFREVVVDNPRFQQVLNKHWKKLRDEFRVAALRLEPVVRRIGDIIFGTQEGGITPEFARVLRNQVLLKDRRWLAVRVAAARVTTSPPSQTTASIPLSFTVRPGPAALTESNPFPQGPIGFAPLGVPPSGGVAGVPPSGGPRSP
ncbi:MAG: hypothetical protein HYS13_13575 [Planctomycetia bacterium]|nr:hypothetical protein [Planctomycetia bacterium]